MKLSYIIVTLWKIVKNKKILGVMIDNELVFKIHLKKIGFFSRLAKIIFITVIKSQFSYCPLVWMFCSRISKNIIHRLHEISLKILINDCSKLMNCKQ